ncbi:hypothetical protein CEUSTIGMA_g210.t1 [Chlamydomonas eustigma]|uniref:Uncharacterized protein n=1 Tax=Chlamydomonas eustigma TaxID=1157962 RepID=A0A250WPI1_9CHLO|nr:hypothetical protein CEUSTIGMA_g210.t1 [Chlamydomonas eustigma]|eukprot:GAX72754.1 hypothetical protein CEUSTIGMA_g210.t1 [Chlamydomonas eustigma]
MALKNRSPYAGKSVISSTVTHGITFAAFARSYHYKPCKYICLKPRVLPFGRGIVENEEYLSKEVQEEEDADISETAAKQWKTQLPIGPLPPNTFSPVPEPEVTLVTRLRTSPAADTKQVFWSDFAFKCRLAWDVFFPQQPCVLSPAGAVKSRLQMILVSDRCGLDLPTLMQIKQSSMTALAQEHGWESMTELEVQVASVKPNGDRIQVSLPLSSIPEQASLRDPSDYDYEKSSDDMDELSNELEASGQFGSFLHMESNNKQLSSK